jgi:hypothetical protein
MVPDVQEPHSTIAAGACEARPVTSGESVAEVEQVPSNDPRCLDAAVEGEEDAAEFGAGLDRGDGVPELPLPAGDCTVDEAAGAMDSVDVEAWAGVGGNSP